MTEPHQAPRRARHLLDPDNPRPPQPRRDGMSLDNVQRWVLSALAATTILHLSGGLVLAAMYVDEDRLDAQVGLNVLGAAFGVVAVAAARAIHGRSLASPWLLLGLVPGILGLWLTLG